MSKKIKILFIVPSLRGGGAERVVSILLQYLDTTKFDLTLVLLQKEGKFLNDIPDYIKIIDLKSKRVRNSISKIIKTIKSENADIVFSTLGHLNLLISILRPFLNKNTIFIGRESNTVSVINKQDKFPKLMDFLYRRFYNNFDYIVAQAQYMKDDLVHNYDIISDKIIVINNPIDFEKVKKLSYEVEDPLFDKSKINLISVGRLAYQKGFDTLIEIMEKLDERFFLTILGQGPDYTKLESLIEEKKLSQKIKLQGFVNNPYPYMRQADFFVLSSRFEGFPNVVLESNACQTPVIAFNCPGGTSEIIEENKNGWLVDCQDKGAFVKKLYSIDYNKSIETKHLEKFKVDVIIKQYENFFIKVMKKK